jgi:peptidoglycan L-alanyl-D-glutamate endopeptidase CwlK
MPNFGRTSTSRLSTCDIRLQRIMNEVVKHYDCTIITGHRTEEEQNIKFAEGTSEVSWPNSKHNSSPSMAVDVAPWPIPTDWGDKEWKDRVKFYELKAIIFFVAAKQGVKIRFGGDWNEDSDYKDNKFDDLVHFEIVE